MKRLVEYSLKGGGTILVEVDVEVKYGVDELVPAASSGKVVRKAEQTLDEALGTIRCLAIKVVEQERDLADSPDELSVEFGVTLSGGVNVVVASGSAEANLNATFTWKGDRDRLRPTQAAAGETGSLATPAITRGVAVAAAIRSESSAAQTRSNAAGTCPVNQADSLQC